MRKSAHKDILKFLQKVIPGGSQGQLSRRICLMACLIQACAFIKENEPLKNLETIVRKDRLNKITPIAIAQLAIKHNCHCAVIFFSNLSKNYQWVFT